MEERLEWRSSEEFISYQFIIMEKKVLKAILEDEIVDWVSVKKWEKHEFDESMADFLLRAYWNHREEVQEEAKEEKKAEKKVSKKK